MVGYNPGDAEHGYLWWLAWLNHNARTLFSVQDANGDFRPLFLQASCATLAQIVNGTPAAAAVLNLTPILSNAGLCPQQSQAIVTAYRKYQADNQGSSAAPAPLSRALGALEGNCVQRRHRRKQQAVPAQAPDQLDGNQRPLNPEDPHDGPVRAVVRGAAAVPVAVVRGQDPVQPAGLPGPDLVHQRR